MPGRDEIDGLAGTTGPKDEPGAPGVPCREKTTDKTKHATTEETAQKPEDKTTYSNNKVTPKKNTKVYKNFYSM